MNLFPLRKHLCNTVLSASCFVKLSPFFTFTSCFSARFELGHFQRHFSRTNSVLSWSKNMPITLKNQTVITISVDGNISSGKSTLVANLKELFPTDFNFQVELVPEPLEKWTNLQGHNLLGMFYDDRTRHNFMFQHYVQLTRLMEAIKQPVKESIIGDGPGRLGTVRILERSLQNNRYCFTELARREGRLQPEEFAVLSEWHTWLEKKFDLTLDLIIYLQTDPQTVYSRMHKRGRTEESSVPMDYLKNLHETYENWLVGGKAGSTCNGSRSKTKIEPESQNDAVYGKSIPNFSSKQRVIVVDGNQSIQEVAKECQTRLNAFMREMGYDSVNHSSSSAKESKFVTT